MVNNRLEPRKNCAESLFRNPEHPFPTNATVLLVEGEPDQNGLANDVVFRYKAPIARISGIVAVVTHHPVIVHLEGVAVSGLAVDEDLVALYL